jgi:hypothetical protein
MRPSRRTWPSRDAPMMEMVRTRAQAGVVLDELLLDLAAAREPQPQELDSHLIAQAVEHRVDGLLWSWAARTELPQATKLELLKLDLRRAARRNQLLDVLRRVQSALDDAGIEFLTLKGFATAARLYERPGERPSVDIDILLREDDARAVRRAVELIQPGHPWLRNLETLVAARRIQSVTTRMSGVEVDIHLDYLKLGVRARTTSEVWSRSVRVDVGSGLVIPALEPAAEFLLLATHLNKDRFQRLLGYADVVRARRGLDDVDFFEHLCRVEGLTALVAETESTVAHDLGLGTRPSASGRPSLRGGIWRVAWRPAIRLRGTEGRMRFRHRQALIGVLARGRAAEGSLAWLRELFPPRVAVAAQYRQVEGGYLRKLVWGRVQAKRASRDALRRIGGPRAASGSAAERRSPTGER